MYNKRNWSVFSIQDKSVFMGFCELIYFLFPLPCKNWTFSFEILTWISTHFIFNSTHKSEIKFNFVVNIYLRGLILDLQQRFYQNENASRVNSYKRCLNYLNKWSKNCVVVEKYVSKHKFLIIRNGNNWTMKIEKAEISRIIKTLAIFRNNWKISKFNSALAPIQIFIQTDFRRILTKLKTSNKCVMPIVCFNSGVFSSLTIVITTKLQ